METVVYIIPFIVAIGLLIFARKKTAWWEYLVLILPSLLLALLVEVVMKKSNVDDVEYLGYYVEKVSYYEPWNRYVHKTCSREVRCGTDKDGNVIYRTETYDCSYVENHPERWTYTLNDGSEEYFYNKKEFDKVLSKLQAKPVFVDMHRHYYTRDGDKYDYKWDGTEAHIYTMTQEHHYDNYVKSSYSLFKYEEISKDDVKKYGLYDYPKIYDYDQCPIIGMKVDKASESAVRYINGFYGKKHQFRIFILIYKDKGVDVVDKQRSYWLGCNKNEFIVCIGYNSKKHTVDWCEAFSWSDAPVLEVKTKDYFLTRNKVDIKGYCEYLKPLIKTDWKRKNFSDFKYIEVELSDTQVTWLFILVLIYNIGISIWIILNQFTAKNPGGEDNRNNFYGRYY